MEVPSSEEVLQFLSSCLTQIKWRLKTTSKRRLETDVLALCTGMRPVVMIDYGGKMPELQDRLLSLLELVQEGLPVFKDLRVMVIEDMIYLINVRRLPKFVSSSLNSEPELFFVNLEQDPPKMVEQSKEINLGMELKSIQKLFSSIFPLDDSNIDATSALDENPSQSSLCIDLSCCLQDTKVTVPTLNGWLLDYPVVYLFSTDHIEEAIYNLSTKSLRLFKVLVCRNDTTKKESHLEELTSFSVPYDLSMEGSKEVWAEAFLERMSARWEECKHIWRSLDLQVSECYPQAIVL